MHKLVMVVYLSLVVAVAAVAADSHKQPSGKPDKQQGKELPIRDVSEPRAGAEREQEWAAEQAESAREEAEELAERERERAAEHGHEDAAQRLRGAENAPSRGNETSQEMRSQRDERKEIMSDYRDGEGVPAEGDGEPGADEEKAKAKKPWWKFWGD